MRALQSVFAAHIPNVPYLIKFIFIETQKIKIKSVGSRGKEIQSPT